MNAIESKCLVTVQYWVSRTHLHSKSAHSASMHRKKEIKDLPLLRPITSFHVFCCMFSVSFLFLFCFVWFGIYHFQFLFFCLLLAFSLISVLLIPHFLIFHNIHSLFVFRMGFQVIQDTRTCACMYIVFIV